MRRLVCLAAFAALAGCELTTIGTPEEPEVLTPPPYPPGYDAAPSNLPDAVRAAVPGDIPDENILKAEGCYFYHRGGTTFAVKDAASGGQLCAAKTGDEVPPVVLPNLSET